MSWIPKFIRQVLDDRSGHVVKADRWNELWNLNIEQGDHNTSAIVQLFAHDGVVDEQIADRYTKLQTDANISAAVSPLVKTITFNSATGVFTITEQGGKVNTIDTNIEKVPARMDLLNVNGNWVLQITNDDGSKTSTDVTNLFQQYTFNDTSTIQYTFIDNGKGIYSVASAVKLASITNAHLAPEVLASIITYTETAQEAAATRSEERRVGKEC